MGAISYRSGLMYLDEMTHQLSIEASEVEVKRMSLSRSHSPCPIRPSSIYNNATASLNFWVSILVT